MDRIAISHDYLTQRGGAERVVLSLSDAFPEAPIYTSFYEPEGTFEQYREKDVRPSVLNAVPFLRKHFRVALPLYPAIFTGRSVDAEVTICSSSGWAHGTRTTGRKIVYCHAPARWLYQPDNYLASFPASAARVLPLLRPGLLAWDRRAAAGANLYVTNSRRTRGMIRDAYGIDAHVLPPPHSIDPAGPRDPVPGMEDGYFLTVSRLHSYKNIIELIDAFREMPHEQLAIVGQGPLQERLIATCPDNVVLLGRVSDAELRWLYAHAAALLAVSYEDLGLTPVEAALFGTPSLALRFGGYLDTVIDGTNGYFIEEISAGAIARSVQLFDARQLDPEPVRQSAARYARDRFEQRLRELVADQMDRTHPVPPRWASPATLPTNAPDGVMDLTTPADVVPSPELPEADSEIG